MKIIKSFLLLFLGSALVVCLIYESKVGEDYAVIFTSVGSAPKKDDITVMQASAAVGNHLQNAKVEAVPDGISAVESTIKTNALETKTVSGQAILGISEVQESVGEMENAVMQEPDTALARSVGETIVNVMTLISSLNEE